MRGDYCLNCDSGEKVRKIKNLEKLLCEDCRAKFPETLAEAREWFDANWPRGRAGGALPSYDALLKIFQDDSKSFTEISEDLGLTRERVRQIYMKYFSKFIPQRPNGRAREWARTYALRQLKSWCSLEQNNRSAGLLKKASKEGFIVEPVPTRGAKASEFLYVLDGCLCKLHVCSSPSSTSRSNKFWHFKVRPEPHVEFHILQTNTSRGPRFLIVPASLVRKDMSIYVPCLFKRSSYHKTIFAKIDWLEYLEAWHLLKQKTA